MRCCGKREGLSWLWLQLLGFLVAVREMAEFVCHTPDHNQGIKAGCVRGRGRRDGGKEKKSKSIKCCYIRIGIVSPRTKLGWDFPFRYNDTRVR